MVNRIPPDQRPAFRRPLCEILEAAALLSNAAAAIEPFMPDKAIVIDKLASAMAWAGGYEGEPAMVFQRLLNSPKEAEKLR